MFESNSRYSVIEDATLRKDNGQVVKYKKRRFIPDGESMPLLQEVAVAAGDRLDLITARLLGNPEQFWRICDANNAWYPFELTSKPGRILRIAIEGK